MAGRAGADWGAGRPKFAPLPNRRTSSWPVLGRDDFYAGVDESAGELLGGVEVVTSTSESIGAAQRANAR